jgi:hypothetical protein
MQGGGPEAAEITLARYSSTPGLNRTRPTNDEERNGPPQPAPKVGIFEPVAARHARNTVGRTRREEAVTAGPGRTAPVAGVTTRNCSEFDISEEA